jgi:hypothetical protein
VIGFRLLPGQAPAEGFSDSLKIKKEVIYRKKSQEIVDIRYQFNI